MVVEGKQLAMIALGKAKAVEKLLKNLELEVEEIKKQIRDQDSRSTEVG